jgi:hypothetical protein
MVLVTNYSTVQSQSNLRLTRYWENLANLASNNNSDAVANNIGIKKANFSNTQNIYLSGFGFNIPSGARIDYIQVKYEHFTTGKLSIGGPGISLNIGGGVKTGAKPKTISTVVAPSVTTWYRSGTWKPTPAQINSPNFGLSFNYPSNTSKTSGSIYIDYITITVRYVVTSVNPATYSIYMNSPEPKTLGENVEFITTLYNTNSTNKNGTAEVDIRVVIIVERVFGLLNLVGFKAKSR